MGVAPQQARHSKFMRLATLPVLAALVLAAAVPGAAQRRMIKIEPNSLAPFVASPQPVVEKMLEVAAVRPGETVFDLGCGDGRILVTAVQQFRAKAVGVELSDRHAKTATEKIASLGIQNDAKVIHGNLMDVDTSSADVVTIYLMTLSNDKLRPKLEHELKPGTRIVSLNYEVRGWKPAKVEKVEASDSRHRPYTIYLYEMPQK